MKKYLLILMVLVLCLSVFVACKPGTPDVEYNVKAASDYLHSDMKDRAEQQAADFTVLSQVLIGGVTYEITWTTDPASAATITKQDGGKTLIDINEKTETEYTFKLIATVKAGNGETATREYTYTVPAYKLSTYEEYIAAEKDAALTVEGIVVGLASKTDGAKYNQIYLQDASGKGGYYLYSLKEDPKEQGIEVGMTVSATGTKDIYSGTHELKDCTLVIVNSDKTTVTPIDISADFAALDSKALLGKYESALVVIKGVEITSQDLSDLSTNGYLNFELEGKETYLRVGGSSLMITKEEQTKYAADHAEHRSWRADVVGVLTAYNGNGYLTAVSGYGFTYLEEIVKTDAEKISESLAEITFNKVDKDTELTLPAKGVYDEVTYAWALTDNAAATLQDNKLTVTLGDAATELTLTLTVTCGETTETKTYTIKVSAKATDLFVPETAQTPAKDTAYKYSYYHAVTGKYYYFDGTLNGGKYLNVTENAADAVDVYVETAETGIYLYFMDGETKTYITIVANDSSAKIALVTEKPAAPFVKGKDDLVWNMTIGETAYYIGNYAKSKYTTMSASKTSYVSKDNIYTEQFPTELGTLAPAAYKPTTAETPAKDTAYKYSYYHAVTGKYYYFDGTLNGGKYLNVTENAADAVDVYVETAETGIYLYFMDGETKTYITIVANDSSAKIALVTEKPAAPFVKGKDDLVWNMTIGETAYYIGNYAKSKYTTMSASKTSYVSKDNIYTEQFPTELGTLALTKLVAERVDAPAKDTAYKYSYYHAVTGKYYYFDGTLNGGKYLNVTDLPSKAVDVYVETVEGGIYLYFMDGETKTYITIVANDSSAKIALVTEKPADPFVKGKDDLVWNMTIGETAYYIGNYAKSKYTTMSASKTSYVSKDNIYTEQFPTELSNIVFYAPVEEDGGEDEGGDETPANKPNQNLQAGTAYVMEATYTEGVRYFSEATASKGLNTVTDKASAMKVYLEAGAAEGQWLIYYMKGEVKTYLTMNGTKTTSFAEVTDKPTDNYWTVDAESGALLNSYETGNANGYRGLGTDKGRTDIRAYYEAQMADGTYCPVAFIAAN